jgi:bile acid-coenzyme A ligase
MMIAEIELGDVPEANASRLGFSRWAVRHGEEALSWGELAERVQRRAHALAEAGIGQDDIVALALPNSNTVYEFTFALWKLGATPMPVSAKLPAAELHGVLQAAEAKWVVTAQPSITAQGVLRMGPRCPVVRRGTGRS